VDFGPQLLTHVQGPLRGKPYQLLPWFEALIVRPLFGWRRRSDGLRRFRKVYLGVGKKNSKTGGCAYIGLYVLHCDGEPAAEIAAVAASKEQAALLFDVARDMNEASPPLADRTTILRRALVVERTRSAFRVYSSDAKTRHGPNIHCLLFDEFHAQPNRDLYDALSRGVAARPQPITIFATTAGSDHESICHEEYEHAKKVLAGVVPDEEYLPVIFEPGPEDDWRHADTWSKANPSLGVEGCVRLDYLHSECTAAVVEPRKQNSFKQLHLNQWTKQAKVWIPVESWKACPGLLAPQAPNALACAAGIDLSTQKDLTACVFVTRRPDGRPEDVAEITSADPAQPGTKKLSINYAVELVPYFWMPEARIAERKKEDDVPYDLWVEKGWLRVTPGYGVDYDFIFRQFVDELAPRHLPQQVGYDPWNATQFAQQLDKEGFTAVEVRQGMRSLSEPSKLLEVLILKKRLHQDGNEVMTWCVSNAGVVQDENGNIRPVKTNDRNRIDGVVAAVIALSRLMVLQEPKRSIYQTRGFSVLRQQPPQPPPEK